MGRIGLEVNLRVFYRRRKVEYKIGGRGEFVVRMYCYFLGFNVSVRVFGVSIVDFKCSWDGYWKFRRKLNG